MALTRGQIEEAAAFLFHLQIQRQTAPAIPPEIAPRTIDDAYAIQDAIHEAAGWPIAVLKVGCTSDAAREALGIPHPIAGRIPVAGRLDSGVTVPRSSFGSTPLIECEIAVRIGPEGIDAVAPAAELVDPRIRATGSFGGLTTVADNSAGAATVIGDAIPIAEACDLGDVDVVLSEGDTEIASGQASAVIGGPTGSVEWVVAHEAGRGRSVDAGLWVITGTCTGLTPATFGSSYRASFGRLGAISFTIGD